MKKASRMAQSRILFSQNPTKMKLAIVQRQKKKCKEWKILGKKSLRIWKGKKKNGRLKMRIETNMKEASLLMKEEIFVNQNKQKNS